MFLRYGTILLLIQETFGYSQLEFSHKLNIPQASLNSYISGARHPGLRSEVRHHMEKLLINVANELKLHISNPSNLALHAMIAEINIRELIGLNHNTFQRVASQILIRYLKNIDYSMILKPPKAHDCLKIIIEEKNDFRSKASIALYLAEKARMGHFNEEREIEEGVVSIPITFPDIYSLINFSENNNITLRLPYTIDVMLSLPDKVNFQYDINNRYHVNVKIELNENISKEPLLFKGSSLMINQKISLS